MVNYVDTHLMSLHFSVQDSEYKSCFPLGLFERHRIPATDC